MTELKPCPFCGGKAELITVPGYFKSGLSSSGWLVKCLNGCCNQAPYMSDHDAIRAWNGRTAMVSITCPCAECVHNGRRYKCTAKEIKLTYRNMATVNEGRVDMWVCNKYELSESAKKIQESFERGVE